jgi:outer membrane protein TolC
MTRRSQPQKWLTFGSGFGFLLLFAGCASMPIAGEHAEFLEPPPMSSVLPQANPQEAAAPGKGWPEDQWWRQFKSPDLDRIMEIALKENPGLKKAYARLSPTFSTGGLSEIKSP